MILQSLVQYCDRLVREEKLPPFGYQHKEIPFVITIDRSGGFRSIADTRGEGGGKNRARTLPVPLEVKRSGRNAWQKANPLWDTSDYVLGVSNNDPETALKKHETFKETIRDNFGDLEDEGVEAVLAFLEDGGISSLSEHPLWDELHEGRNVAFRLEGDETLVSSRPGVRKRVAKLGSELEAAGTGLCMITHEDSRVAKIHPSIRGVYGAQSSGGNIVSFNCDAFESFGKEQGANAPVGVEAAIAYTSALNYLLSRSSGQRLLVADTTVVFWAREPSEMESLFLQPFDPPKESESEQDKEQMRALYSSPRSGSPPMTEEETEFYVLGLAPNAARLSIRFWSVSTVGEIAKNILRYFDELEIVHREKEPPHLPLYWLLRSTAAQGKSENIQPNLAGKFMEAIIEGTPYPSMLLTAAVRRIAVEKEITYPRAALIKAVLVRNSRYYGKTEKEVGMSLDRENTNQGYLMGRLFAILERAQERANPGINSTIRDRFYASASGTPATAFPHLLKLNHHHVSKLKTENTGTAVNLEKLTTEVMKDLEDFPQHLDLQEQGRFAIGYYHQRHDFFQSKNKTGENETMKEAV